MDNDNDNNNNNNNNIGLGSMLDNLDFNVNRNISSNTVKLDAPTVAERERMEKYKLVKLERNTKVSKGATIGGAITTAAMAATTALGIAAIPVAGIAAAGALTLVGGVSYLKNKIELNSMVRASRDESIGELAQEIEGGYTK